jgi:hypothetical protein
MWLSSLKNLGFVVISLRSWSRGAIIDDPEKVEWIDPDGSCHLEKLDYIKATFSTLVF